MEKWLGGKETDMGKKSIIASVIVLSLLAGFAKAADEELHGSVDLMYLSKFVWRGLDVYDDKSATQASVTLDLWKTGFGTQIHSSRANSDGFENSEWLRYYLFYDNVLWPDERCQTNYRLGYYYYNFPDNSPKDLDAQEVHLALAWPKALVEGLVPSYVLVKMWPSHSDSLIGANSDTLYGAGNGGTASGFAHIFMLDYAWMTTCPFTGEPRAINLHSEAVFNDGVGPQGQNIDHDWTNAVFGASTDFDLSSNMVFTPGVYYQVTMDKSCVAAGSDWDKDEFWATANLKIKF